jgi:D-3-phosphoglycerate dehydrogenase / 2-oxoglutarate reductase
MPLNVLLLESIHPVAKAALEAEGFKVELLKGSIGEAELVKKLDGVDVLGIRSKTQVTEAVLKSAKNLFAVGAFCIGTNQIRLDAAVRHGVCVFNAPFSNTRSVAELVMAEVVMLSRQLGDRIREMHAGRWRKLASGSHEVRGKTIGVVGYGHIGTQVGILAEFFGMRVIFYDVAQKLPLGNCRPVPSLDALLEESDFVTLHVPETPQTRNMIGAAQIKRMKPGACLLNDARGSVVDIAALVDGLKSGRVGGAALDVFPEEPEANELDGFQTELQGLPNVILTPHIGGSTVEAQEAIGREVAASLTRFVKTGATTSSVNFPHVELAQIPGTHRVINVHQNVPGVMRDVNKIVGDQGANIHAQVLSTAGDIGYLVMDLDNPVSTAVADAMKKLPTTIHARAV